MTATRRLVAILAADIAGYSRLMGADEEGTLAALKAIRRERWDAKVEDHRGRIVKTTGDGLLVEFASVVDAVRCAVEVQRGMAERNAHVPAEKRIEFRIGINLGDVILDEGDIYGDGVNIAARLEAFAEPGEICVSRVVRDQVRDRLEVSFEDAGEQRVKNIARPVHVYRISIAGHVSTSAQQKGDAGFRIRRPEAFIAATADTFVGRQRELEVLRGAFEQACAGHGRIVMLAGEPGIGKTRTALELAGHAAQREAAVLWGRCHEESGAPPYWPWVQVIRASLRDADPDLLAGLGAQPDPRCSAPIWVRACPSWRAISKLPAMMPTATEQSNMRCAPADGRMRCSPSRKAVQFFQTALDAIEQQTEPDEAARCRVLLLLGEAQRKSGDFSNALATLGEAARSAGGLGLPDVLANAALAYEQAAWRSGLSPDLPSRRLLEEALREVPEAKLALRARLSGALGRALLYANAETEGRAQVTEAVVMSRQVGDPAVLATNLSYLFGFYWGPASTEDLLHPATEMVAAAEEAGDPELMLNAHGYRLPLSLQLGDMQAVATDLDALMKMDARIRQRTYSITLRGYNIMVALMRGEFAEAERLILEVTALARNLVVHDDQVSMQIFTLRREQGRLAGLRPVVSAFLQQSAAASVWRPGLMLLYFEIGQPEQARKEYEQLVGDFPVMPRDGRWHYSLVYLSEVCAALGDAARAPMLYSMMLPYTGRNIVLGLAIACCGSADRYLGLLCTAMARWPEAKQHFERRWR